VSGHGTPQPAVVLTDATVTYGRVVALGPLSLTVPAGQSVALVGPSGAGKTSLLRLLAGQLAPASGSVVIGGRDLSRLPGRRELPRLVGLLPQQLDLIPQLSVKHNVQAGALGRWGLLRAIGALLLPLEHPPARAAVQRIGLGDRFADRVADLSGGEQQRVALARLLVQDPALVLADEPVASLDPARAAQLLDLLRTAAREEGRTLLTSLHDPEVARRHVDRMIGLRDGRVVFDLPPQRVTTDLLAGLYRLLSPVDAPAQAKADTG
jgi:phosphonate transport system ATP-binding protein